jgi:hypothetical protein
LGALEHGTGVWRASAKILMDNLVIFTRGTNPTVPLVKMTIRKTSLFEKPAIEVTANSRLSAGAKKRAESRTVFIPMESRTLR